MQVIKRDGRIVEFDKNKIKHAVLKALKDVKPIKGDEKMITSYEDYISSYIADDIADNLKDYPYYSVEEIQDMVEECLMDLEYKDVARKYIIYRNDRSRAREKSSELSKLIKEKITASNVQNQNANVDEKSFGGRMGAVQEEVLKEYALNNCMSEMARNNHLNNEVYTHDLAHFAAGDHNCLSIPIDDFLDKPILTRQVDLRPCKSMNSFGQVSAVDVQLQSLQQFGGVSYTHYDWSCVPYVRMSFYKHWKDGLKYLYQLEDLNDYPLENMKEKCRNYSIEDDFYKAYDKAYEYAMDMTEREVYQAMEALFHNLNSLQSRSGNQLNTRWLVA